MKLFDWIVLIATLLIIIVYGVWKSRGQKSMDGYFLANQSMPWYIVLLSIMGTQASAITFLSAPGQAYTDGMRFVQYYFGLPLAMVVLSVTFVPIYRKFKVFTAYEFLEQRFDLKTRTLTSLLFLISRGLSTGISILAPSIILSSLLGWNVYLTNIFMGGLLIIYTVVGGTKAVAYTQKQQFIIIFLGMFLAGYMIVNMLPTDISFMDALHVAGKSGKLNVITTEFNLKDRYNIWSGLIGGFFLALSYFGTDQSQVGRYITAKSVSESRIGLLMNGIVKVPMQFLILLVGALLFTFYQFHPSPLFFNEAQVNKVKKSELKNEWNELSKKNIALSNEKKEQVNLMVNALHAKNDNEVEEINKKLLLADERGKEFHKQASTIIKKADAAADTNDTNYIFLYFVINYLPQGLVGLLIAVIFLSAWGSIAAALNSLASTTVVDIYQRFNNKEHSDKNLVYISKVSTFIWGVFCIGVAQFATDMGSLIEAVNILGSLFYGTILGIFLVAFYFKNIKGSPVFWAAIIAELLVITIYRMDIVSFLWLNVVGCVAVVFFGLILNLIFMKRLLKVNN